MTALSLWPSLYQIYPYQKCIFLVIACYFCCWVFGRWAGICTEVTTMDVQQLTIFFLLRFARVCLHNLAGFTGYSFWLHEVVLLSCLWLYEWVVDALTLRNIMHVFNLLNYVCGRWGLAPLLMCLLLMVLRVGRECFGSRLKWRSKRRCAPKKSGRAEIQEAIVARDGGLGGWWLSSKTVEGSSTWEVEATYFGSLELVCYKILITLVMFIMFITLVFLKIEVNSAL